MNYKKILRFLLCFFLVFCLFGCKDKNEHTHDFNVEFSYNENGHFKRCTGCSEISEYEIHNFTAWKVVEPATSDKAGKEERTCKVCGYVQSSEVEYIPHNHDYNAKYAYDETNHYHECSICFAKKDVEAHKFDDGTITKQATNDSDGEKTYKCTVCGYEKVESYKKGYENDGKFSFDTDEIIGGLDPVESDITFARKHFDDSLKTNGPLTQTCLPSIGSPKVLVIPINLDNDYKDKATLDEINLAFNGKSEDTGWESVSSYYKKSSYGKLNFEFIVEDWFTPSKDADYYDEYENGDECGIDLLLDEALKYYDSKYDYNDFDYDNDKCIDAIWLIYNCEVNYDSYIYWAYTSTASSSNKKTYDGCRTNYISFAGTDFMHEEAEHYDTIDFVVDAHTFIHETGHLLGLDDYYDYDEKVGSDGTLYGACMMDWNMGDHCPVNKLLLGWIDPIVVTGTKGASTYDLTKFETTGDCLIISDHELTSIYDEYIVIEFYDNVGLNENDKPILDNLGIEGDTSKACGIRIVHVDAHQNIKNGKVVANSDKAYPKTGFKYNNSGTSYCFIEMLSANNATCSEDDKINADALFKDNSKVFGLDVYENFEFNDDNKLFFTLTVLNIDDSNCKISIEYK